ncbi:hypothetical protein PJV89_11100 [Aliarcobacter butzleri]|nr:hypothetical protein [Aliarcobacter butzleri]
MKNKLKKTNFTMISKVIVRDNQLSLKAKGMALIIAHFPLNWCFYQEKLQDYSLDRRTSIANALKELENRGYLKRMQIRVNGRFSNKIWKFNDECILGSDETESRKTTTTNTHSNNIKESNKKNTQKKNKRRAYFEFVNRLKDNALSYPNLIIEFEDKKYCFAKINEQLLLQDVVSKIILSKIHADRIYQKMALSLDLIIDRGVSK